MDWIHENKLKTAAIIGLLLLNLVMVTLMWWKQPHASAPPAADDTKRGPGSAALMKQALDLSDDQTAKIDAMLRARRDQAKTASDSLAALKLRLAEELFIDPPDTARALTLASGIGNAQATVEMNRYRSFREILTVLTPDQRTAFKPVVTELFGRKPPREEGLGARGRATDRPHERPAGQDGTKRHDEPAVHQGEDSGRDVPPPPPGNEPPSDRKDGPPTIEEKLARYTERLHLTDEQARGVERILHASREKGRALRDQRDPDRVAVDAAKEQIRKEEDDGIMRPLTDEQKQIFSAMRARKPR